MSRCELDETASSVDGRACDEAVCLYSAACHGLTGA